MEHNGSPFPKVYKLLDRAFVVEENKYIKRELAEDECFRRPNGRVLYPYWMRERIQNEADAIRFVRANTTIPVPQCELYEEGGLLHLDIHPVPGVMLDDIEEGSKHAAADVVTKQMDEVILPQLRKLRRHFIGSVNPSLPVIPPSRIYRRDRRSWQRITSAPEDPAFVFCHNDLSNRNIFVDPKTFRITGIIDWQFAGYFPPEWELRLWPLDWNGRESLYQKADDRDLALFGLTPGDLNDCLEEGPGPSNKTTMSGKRR